MAALPAAPGSVLAQVASVALLSVAAVQSSVAIGHFTAMATGHMTGHGHPPLEPGDVAWCGAILALALVQGWAGLRSIRHKMPILGCVAPLVTALLAADAYIIPIAVGWVTVFACVRLTDDRKPPNGRTKSVDASLEFPDPVH